MSKISIKRRLTAVIIDFILGKFKRSNGLTTLLRILNYIDYILSLSFMEYI